MAETAGKGMTWSAAATLEEAGAAGVLGEVDCPAKTARPENTGWVVFEYCTLSCSIWRCSIGRNALMHIMPLCAIPPMQGDTGS